MGLVRLPAPRAPSKAVSIGVEGGIHQKAELGVRATSASLVRLVTSISVAPVKRVVLVWRVATDVQVKCASERFTNAGSCKPFKGQYSRWNNVNVS